MKVPQNEDELIPPEDVLETAKEKIERCRRMYPDEDFRVYMTGYDMREIDDYLRRVASMFSSDIQYHILGQRIEEADDLMQGQVIVMHDREDEERYIGR